MLIANSSEYRCRVAAKGEAYAFDYGAYGQGVKNFESCRR